MLLSPALDAATIGALLRRLDRPTLLTDVRKLDALADVPLADLTSRLVIVSGSRPDAASLSDLAGAPRVDPVFRQRDEPAMITHTSGTTGLPKLVVHTPRTMAERLRPQWRLLALMRRRETVTMHISFVHSRMFAAMALALFWDMPVLLMKESDPDLVAEFFLENRPGFHRGAAQLVHGMGGAHRRPAEAFRLGEVLQQHVRCDTPQNDEPARQLVRAARGRCSSRFTGRARSVPPSVASSAGPPTATNAASRVGRCPLASGRQSVERSVGSSQRAAHRRTQSPPRAREAHRGPAGCVRQLRGFRRSSLARTRRSSLIRSRICMRFSPKRAGASPPPVQRPRDLLHPVQIRIRRGRDGPARAALTHDVHHVVHHIPTPLPAAPPSQSTSSATPSSIRRALTHRLAPEACRRSSESWRRSPRPVVACSPAPPLGNPVRCASTP